ncbi:hypothetical protein ACWPKS_01565 [Coraliomargarita sp. W4R72]
MKKSILTLLTLYTVSFVNVHGAEFFTEGFSDASAANWSTRVNGSTPSTFIFDGDNASLTEGNGLNADAMYRSFSATALEVGDSITVSGRVYMNVSQAFVFRVGPSFSATGIGDSIGVTNYV